MASITNPAEEPVEQISHRARDWYDIGEKLLESVFEGKHSKELRPLGRHLCNKGVRAVDTKGEDFVFSETLTKPDATAVREIAKSKGMTEKSGSAT